MKKNRLRGAKVSIGVIVALSFLLPTFNLCAQDIHFSQLNNSPLQINPGLTGRFNGDFRGAIQYRNQWQSIGAPYKTYAVSADGHVKRWDNSYLAAGLFIYSDKAGDVKLSTTQVLVSIAEHIKVNGKNIISAGFQGGFGQRSMTGDNLRWGNQYNGFKHDTSIPGEQTSFGSFYYGDYALGLAWSFAKNAGTLSSNDNVWFKAGVAYHHLNKPNLKYYDDVSRLYSKVLFHAQGHIGLKNTSLGLRPSILFNNQGPQNEINGGLLVRYQLSEASKYTGLKKASAISIGSYYRFKDAIIPTVQFEYSNITIGVSYDVNISKLTAVTSGKGGIEIFLKYQTPNPFGSSKTGKSRSRFN